MTRTILAIAGLCAAIGFAGGIALALPQIVGLAVVGAVGMLP